VYRVCREGLSKVGYGYRCIVKVRQDIGWVRVVVGNNMVRVK